MLAHVQSRVITGIGKDSESQFRRTYRPDINRTAPEDPVKNFTPDINTRYNPFPFQLAGSPGPFPPVFFDRLIHVELLVFIESHIGRIPVVKRAYFVPENILVGFRVIFYLSGKVLRGP